MHKKIEVPTAAREFGVATGHLGYEKRWGKSTPESRKNEMAWPGFILQLKKGGLERAIPWLVKGYGLTMSNALLAQWRDDPKKASKLKDAEVGA